MIDYRILNNPIRLDWGGWETDTLKLGQMGWNISAEQDIHYNRMRIAISHPTLNVQGITVMEEFYFRDLIEGRMRSPKLPVSLRFENLHQRIFVEGMRDSNVSMSPIDYRPQFVEKEIHTLDDFAHFSTKPIEVPRREVYLHEANIDQILEMALERQAPDQERIRQEMLRNQEVQNMRMGSLHTELRLVA